LIDLQLSTIAKPLRHAIPALRGPVLDVGAGQAPWRGWLPPDALYCGLDIEHAGQFGMPPEVPDVITYPGREMPFEDASFSAALCIEVLEHAPDPVFLLEEISRVLQDDGRLVLTVPWSARRHHIPHDYHRFTRERLADLLSVMDFVDVAISERGTDVAVVANKLVVLNIRWLKPIRSALSPLMLLMGLACLPLTVLFLVLAHLAEHVHIGSNQDPLGYFVEARRRTRTAAEPIETAGRA
jgi:SAM-dependent methyltransferase